MGGCDDAAADQPPEHTEAAEAEAAVDGHEKQTQGREVAARLISGWCGLSDPSESLGSSHLPEHHLHHKAEARLHR